ncbi:MAG: hypothetical protein QM770_17390 [Tepidisphaeraceae bacterium]
MKTFYFDDLNSSGKLDAGDYYAAGRVVKTDTIADGVTHTRETYYIDQIRVGGVANGMRATTARDEAGRWTTSVQDELGRTVYVIEHGTAYQPLVTGTGQVKTELFDLVRVGDYLTQNRYGYVGASNFGIANSTGLTGPVYGLTPTASDLVTQSARAYTFSDSIERRVVTSTSLTESINAKFVTRRYTNKRGQLVAVAQPDLNNDGTLDGVWKYEYDAYGNETKQIDPVNHITSFAYDSFGRRTSRTMPPDSDGVTANDTESWSFDANGQTKSHVDFMGQTTAYVYYAKSDGPTLNGQLHFEYRFGAAHRADAVVNGVVNASVASERSEYGYDTLGRPTTVTEYDAGAGGSVTRQEVTTYDPLTGGVTSVTSPEGTIHYEHNASTGRLTRTWTSNNDTTYDYTALGQLRHVIATKLNGVTLSTPITTTYHYNLDGTLDTVSEDAGTTAVATDDLVHQYGYNAFGQLTDVIAGKADGHKLFTQAFTLEADGQRDFVIEERYDGTSATPFSMTKIDWTYDAWNRLTAEQRDEGNDAVQNGNDYTDTYYLDNASNRWKKTHDAVGTA